MIEFKSEVTAELLDVDGDEERIAARARVSTQRNLLGVELAEARTRNEGLLRSLVRERHGSPFESCTMTWSCSAPIFVAREMVRHRLSSWNEMSGRYIELEPVFYVPGPGRDLIKTPDTKQMQYATQPGTEEQQHIVDHDARYVATVAWDAYRRMLDAGVLREVARQVLPVNIFTGWHWSVNLRSLTNLLSLRIRHPESHIESRPMIEAQWLCEQMEHDFALHFPTVWSAWNSTGRLPL